MVTKSKPFQTKVESKFQSFYGERLASTLLYCNKGIEVEYLCSWDNMAYRNFDFPNGLLDMLKNASMVIQHQITSTFFFSLTLCASNSIENN